MSVHGMISLRALASPCPSRRQRWHLTEYGGTRETAAS